MSKCKCRSVSVQRIFRKSPSQCFREKVMSETPKYGLYVFLNYHPFKPLLNYQHCRLWRSFFFELGSKNNRNCPPLSALSIHHDTPRLHQAFLPPMPRTHANALATEVMQHRMAQRHHLSKALAVSLLKNHYSNEGFCRGKGSPHPSIWSFFAFLIRV